MYKLLNKRNRKEEGQAMIEFVLCLPFFLLILAMILDYGWLFYNQLGMENSARNAARVACVEYSEVCLMPPDNKYPYDNPAQTFVLDDVDFNSVYEDEDTDDANQNDEDLITTQEMDILREVKNTVPSSLTDVEVTIEYTYDSTQPDIYYAKNRKKGDVVVTVNAIHHAITPLVGFGTSDGTTRMQRKLTCKSVYKVEKEYIS